MKHWNWVWIWTVCFVFFFCGHPLCASESSPFGRSMGGVILKPMLPATTDELNTTGYTPGAGVKEFVWHWSLLRAAWANLVTSLISLFNSRDTLVTFPPALWRRCLYVWHLLWHFEVTAFQSWAVSSSEVGIGSWYHCDSKMYLRMFMSCRYSVALV